MPRMSNEVREQRAIGALKQIWKQHGVKTKRGSYKIPPWAVTLSLGWPGQRVLYDGGYLKSYSESVSVITSKGRKAMGAFK